MKNLFTKITIALISTLALPFVIWNITFGFAIGYVLLVLFASVLLLSIKRISLKPLFVAIIVGLVLYIAMMPLTMKTMNTKTASYQERVSNGGHLSVIEKWNIYGINITASIIAYPYFPEASTEFMYMMIPTKNGVRYFESDFFMESKRLTDAFKKNNKGRVQWYQKHYNITNNESRSALALNICTYEVNKTRDGTKYQVFVPVRFPKRCRSTFFESDFGFLSQPLIIRVEEGLFRYLEEEGWLFGYDAVWTYLDKK